MRVEKVWRWSLEYGKQAGEWMVDEQIEEGRRKEVQGEEEGNTKSHGCLGALCKIDGGDERPHKHRAPGTPISDLYLCFSLSNLYRQQCTVKKARTEFFLIKVFLFFLPVLSLHALNMHMASGKSTWHQQLFTQDTFCSENVSHHLLLYCEKMMQ